MRTPRLLILGLTLAASAAWSGPPPARAARKPVRLVAVGDLMVGTPQVAAIIRAQGPEHPFRPYRELLSGADLAFGNLETPLSERGTPTPGKSPESIARGTNYIFRAPTSTAAGLAWAGFDVVALANNHAMDYGGVALQDTIRVLKKAGVRPVGAGNNLREAFAPVYFERNGQRLALLAISDILPALSIAGSNTPGLAPARGGEFEATMPAAIRAAKQRADWVLVSVHWGKERYTGATPKQTRLGRRLVDWGADVVIGHHTHCMGPIEKYRGSLIHYSLGNFIAYPSSRANVEAWDVTLPTRGRPTQISHVFRWDGTPLRKK